MPCNRVCLLGFEYQGFIVIVLIVLTILKGSSPCFSPHKWKVRRFSEAIFKTIIFMTAGKIPCSKGLKHCLTAELGVFVVNHIRLAGVPGLVENRGMVGASVFISDISLCQ